MSFIFEVVFVSLNASTMSEKISIGAMGERIINIGGCTTTIVVIMERII